MSGEDAEGVAGRPIEDATDAVAARAGTPDRETVRAVLDRVAEDGVVGWDGVEAALAEVSKVVSTAETRVEVAGDALADAREAAAPVAERDAVRARLEGFESRLASLEAAADDLGADLQGIVGRADEPGALYAAARDLDRLDADARSVQRAADELQMELEAFERWVGSHEARIEELEGDADALAAALDALDGTVDALATADGDGDPGAAWFDATLRARVLSLLLADLRAELADVRAMAEEGEGMAAVADRIDEVEARLGAVGERLDDHERPAWRERFAERLEAFEAALGEFEPPVDWGAVYGTLEEHRPATGEE